MGQDEIDRIIDELHMLEERLISYIDKQNAERKSSANHEHELIRKDIASLEKEVFGINGTPGLKTAVAELKLALDKRTTLVVVINALAAIGAGILITIIYLIKVQ